MFCLVGGLTKELPLSVANLDARVEIKETLITSGYLAKVPFNALIYLPLNQWLSKQSAFPLFFSACGTKLEYRRIS